MTGANHGNIVMFAEGHAHQPVGLF
jgi:hypothetical protein